jgi:hypothetical protein
MLNIVQCLGAYYDPIHIAGITVITFLLNLMHLKLFHVIFSFVSDNNCRVVASVLNLEIETICSSETSVDFQRIIFRYIQEDRNLRSPTQATDIFYLSHLYFITVVYWESTFFYLQFESAIRIYIL